MDEIEIPEYFICPISLQIMRDPVTAITGITYDRRSIEHWIFDAGNDTCPVTNQHLPPDSDLTPNHTLRRLIQAWCHQNGADRIPTPKPPLTRLHVAGLLKNLRNVDLQLNVLRQLEVIAAENDRSRKHLADAGAVTALLALIVDWHDESESRGGHAPPGVEEAVSILNFVRISPTERKTILAGNNNRIVESLTWLLSFRSENHGTVRSHAVRVIRKVLETATTAFLDRLDHSFFARLTAALGDRAMTQQAVTSALRVMLDACNKSGRNRVLLVEAGAVFAVVELELAAEAEERKRTELALGVLFHLCTCADGRAALLGHAAGMAVVAKKILRVSPAADERAVMILGQISRNSSGDRAVGREMVKVGAVVKLVGVLQVGCAAHLKAKAAEIIRSHYQDWKTSPCIANSNLLTHFLR